MLTPILKASDIRKGLQNKLQKKNTADKVWAKLKKKLNGLNIAYNNFLPNQILFGNIRLLSPEFFTG